jgi:hypothetical protein
MAKHTENRVGPIIERRLRELGKSQQWLADRVGVSPVSVHNWIKNGTIARQNLGPAAVALEMTTNQLMGEDQPEHKPAISEEAPVKVSLQWLLPDEQELLENYRLCTDEGKNMTRSFVKVAPKKSNGETNLERRYAA